MIVVTRTYILDCIHDPCCVLLPCALALIFDVISSHVTPTGIAARAIGPPGLRLGPSFAPIAILEQNSFASSSYNSTSWLVSGGRRFEVACSSDENPRSPGLSCGGRGERRLLVMNSKWNKVRFLRTVYGLKFDNINS